MIVAAIILAASAPTRDPLTVALECEVYAELAMSIHGDRPPMLLIDDRIHRYWSTEARRIAATRQKTPEQLAASKLVIAIESDRYAPILTNCLKTMPKKALR
ncbi:hypothetical protein ASE90_18010 [Sphingomonas sp. Leaf67]|nr:hypothetical protein ASE90_18010 [Sphingomonas sp. Leaf67]